MAPGVSRLLIEAGADLARISQPGPRWVCSKRDREMMLEKWNAAVAHAKEALL